MCSVARANPDILPSSHVSLFVRSGRLHPTVLAPYEKGLSALPGWEAQNELHNSAVLSPSRHALQLARGQKPAAHFPPHATHLSTRSSTTNGGARARRQRTEAVHGVEPFLGARRRARPGRGGGGARSPSSTAVAHGGGARSRRGGARSPSSTVVVRTTTTDHEVRTTTMELDHVDAELEHNGGSRRRRTDAARGVAGGPRRRVLSLMPVP